jgi:hypothetical protein
LSQHDRNNCSASPLTCVWLNRGARVMTDDELSRTIRETYRDLIGSYHGTKEHALSTCEVILRVHRSSAGREGDRRLIAQMLAEEPVA